MFLLDKCTGKGSLLIIMFVGNGSCDILELAEECLDLGYMGDGAMEEEDVPVWRCVAFPELSPKNVLRALVRDW